MQKTACSLAILVFATASWGQFSSTASHIRPVATLPTTCRPATGDVVFLTSGSIGTYQCLTTNVWTPVDSETITTPVVDCLCAHAKDAVVIYGGVIQQAYVPTGATGGTLYADTDTWTTTGGSCTTQPAGTLTAVAGVLSTLTVTTKGAGCSTQPTLVPATTGSGAVVLFSACNNTTDVVGSIQTFNSVLSVPGNTFVAGTRYRLTIDEAFTTPASNSGGVSMSLRYGSTTIWRTSTTTPTAGWVNSAFTQIFTVTSPAVSSLFASAPAINFGGQTSAATSSAVSAPVSVSTTSTANLGFGLLWSTTGIASGTCSDAGNKCGLTVSGSAGQTCLLTAFNGAAGTGATATVYLTGSNVIANGSPLYITNTGAAYSGASTTATGGNGTATCSGTATVATVLGGAQGNAINISVFTAKREQ